MARLDDLSYLTPEAEEEVRQHLAGIPPLLEVSPLAVLVVAHVGQSLPERPKVQDPDAGFQPPDETEEELALAPGINSVPSLEPIVDILLSVCEGGATSVEFASHLRWMGEAKDFAAQVRADTSDNKVFLLENMAAIPEQVGIKRTVVLSEDGDASAEKVNAVALSWASREAWAQRAFQAILPEVYVQDAFAGVCRTTTLNMGLWPGAPQKVVGLTMDGEIAGFNDALKLNFGGAAAKPADPGSPTSAEGEKVPAPLLLVLGGGGYGAPDGESALLRKLELFLGLSQLVKNEKDGLCIFVGGELAVCLLACVLGVKMGKLNFKVSDAVLAALKDALRDVLALGVKLILPPDLVGEKEVPPPPEPAADEPAADPKAKSKAKAKAAPVPEPEAVEEKKEEEPEVSVYPLRRAFKALSETPVSLGFVKGEECFSKVDPELGILTMTVGLPPPPEEEPMAKGKGKGKGKGKFKGKGKGYVDDSLEPEFEEEKEKEPDTPPMEVLPEGWYVRDVGDLSVELLGKQLRRSRGVLWNGALGMIEDERWQKGTRSFLSLCGGRIGGGEDEEDEEAVEEAAEEEEEEGDEEGEDEEARRKLRKSRRLNGRPLL